MISNLLNQKPPKPVAPLSDPVLFSKDGRLREQFHELCLSIGLDPQELEIRKLDSFKEKDLSYSAQVLRFNHFENKRQAKIEALKTLAREKNPNMFPKRANPQGTREPDTPSRRKSGLLELRRASHTTDTLKKTKNQQSQDDSLNLSAIQDKEKTRIPTNASGQKYDTYDKEEALSDRSDTSFLSLNSSFRNLITKKTLEKQRRIDAMKKSRDLSEEHVSSCRQKIQTKEQKFFLTINKNQTSFQKKLKEKNALDNEKKGYIQNLQKQDAKSRRTKEKKLNELMQRGQLIASANKNSRLNSLMERESHWQQVRHYIEEFEERQRTIDVDDKLSDFQNKMNRSIDLHYNQLSLRVAPVAQHNQNVSMIYRSAREQEELDKKIKMAAMVNKMTKAEAHAKKTRIALSTMQSESVTQKLQEAAVRKKQVDRDRLKTLNVRVIQKHHMKDKFWRDKKTELQEHIQAKKEASNLRRDDVQENLMIYTTAKSREYERKLENYIEKTKRFYNFKSNAKKELHELERSFRLHGKPTTPRAKTPAVQVNTNMTMS